MPDLTILIGVWNLVKKNKKVQSAIDKTVDEFMEGFTRTNSTQPQPTLKEQKANLRKLIETFTENDCESDFDDRLEYFGALLGLIVQTTRVSKRGCLFEKLFLRDHFFYFPPPDRDYSLVHSKPNFMDVPICAMVFKDPATDRQHFYEFYMFPSNGKSASELANELKEIENDQKGVNYFLNSLKNSGLQLTEFTGVTFHEQKYKFVRGMFEEPVNMTFGDPKTKPSIKSVLNDALDHSLS